MCETPPLLVIKSNSAGDLLGTDAMTLIPESPVSQSVELSKLKRTFTLPRNPFNATRMSKRRIKTKENEQDSDNKKVFRRPSFRRLEPA
ncbi:hypothetical protein Zmor_024248 [Zophobas morio]|uniref:Uncharacterized protein n=1 Tax=Zophobas morio TaxID=2755281 RepID=A0AA38M8L5_9CUCU|nr:hypothetical protein Zmor_024248 [Zophobas morio]